MPGAGWHPRSRVQDALKNAHTSIQVQPEQRYGAHSNDDEYVKLASIVPRLYLSARMIMDVSQDKVK
jgi:glutamate carboxypeptidase